MQEIPIYFIIAILSDKNKQDAYILWNIYNYVSNSECKKDAFYELQEKGVFDGKTVVFFQWNTFRNKYYYIAKKLKGIV